MTERDANVSVEPEAADVQSAAPEEPETPEAPQPLEPSMPAGEPEAPVGPSRPHGDELEEALPETED
jgi:hypothetical protein